MPRKRPTLFEVRYSEVPNRLNHWRIVGFIHGVRKQFWFPDEKSAKAAASDRNVEILAHGTQLFLTPADRVRAASAAERLAPFNKTLDDATNFYISHLKALPSSIPVSELCRVVREEFETRLQNNQCSLRHRNTMLETLKKLETRFNDFQTAELTGVMVKEWLSAQPWATKTRNKLLGYIRNAWNIGVEKGIISSPLAVKNFPRGKKQEAPPNPLTPEEAQRLLAHAENSVMPYIAIGMFAGLRSAERESLDWKNIHLDAPEPYIDLSAKIAKTGRRRLVPILPALQAFLVPIAKSEGRIIPLTCNGRSAYQNAWERSVKAAGLWPWHPNRLRDSFVSYRYEHTGSAELTAKEAGHSVAIMLDRYQKVVSRGAAEKFWGIRPALHSPLFSILSSSIRSGDSPESQMKLKAMLRERIARIDFDFTPVFNDDGTVVYHQRDGAGRFLDLAGYQFSEKAGPVVRVQFTNKADRCVVLDDDKAMLLRPE